MPFHEAKVSSVVVGTRAVSVRSFAWNERPGMRPVGEEGVSETVQDASRKSLVDCTCQASTFFLGGHSHPHSRLRQDIVCAYILVKCFGPSETPTTALTQSRYPRSPHRGL